MLYSPPMAGKCERCLILLITCALLLLYCWTQIGFPPAYPLKLFQTFSISFLTTFLNLFPHNLSHPLVCLCHGSPWVPALPSSVYPKLCCSLSQMFPHLKFCSPAFSCIFSKGWLLDLIVNKNEHAWEMGWKILWNLKYIHSPHATINNH